jgi:protein gp37
MIFVNSMSDMFHSDVPEEFIIRAFEVMRAAYWHKFQVLTKRSSRLVEIDQHLQWPANVWMGVSVENADYVYRIDDLKRTCAVTKFLSLEPLIGPLENLELNGIDWVIVGGESGPGAREMRLIWVQSIRDQCQRANVPFFFKQWGKRQFNPDVEDPTIDANHPQHAKGGCQLNGEIYRDLPAHRRVLTL